MKRLVIIGNGFDLGHGLKTRFSDFIASNEIYPKRYEKLKGHDEEPDWNNVEDNFKYLLIETMEDRVPFFLSEELENKIDEFGFDEYGDINYFPKDKSDNFDDEFNEILDDVDLLNDFEQEFLVYMNKECAPSRLRKLKPAKRVGEILQNTNLVISFNYTKLVEELYHFDNVIHIHGVLENKDIFIGTESLQVYKKSVIDDTYPTDIPCKNKYDFQEKQKYYMDDGEGNDYLNQGYIDTFNNIKESNTLKENDIFDLLDKRNKETLPLRKRVKERLKKEKYDEVYVLGHSLGDADFEVLNCINKDAKFFCFYYGDKPNEVMERTLKRLGVNAEIISNGDLYEAI